MRTNARALSKIETDLEGEFKREAASPIKIGRLLNQAKELLTEHGEWLAWLGDHFPHAARTAQRYMGAAAFAAKYDTVSHLKLAPGALYELASIDNEGDGELVQAVLARAETAWIDRDGVNAIAEELRQLPASDHADGSEPPALPPPPPDSGPPPPPPPALTPKAAALVASFDKAVEGFKPLLAKRAADFVASSKPDHELREIANFLGQVIAGRQDEPKQLAPPTRPSAPSPTITLGADEYSEQTVAPPSSKPVTAGSLDVPALLAGVLAAADEHTDERPGEPETMEQKSARADAEVVDDGLAAGAQMSEKNDGEWKIVAAGKGKNRQNPVSSPVDIAAAAAKLGIMPVSPNTAAAQ